MSILARERNAEFGVSFKGTSKNPKIKPGYFIGFRNEGAQAGVATRRAP